MKITKPMCKALYSHGILAVMTLLSACSNSGSGSSGGGTPPTPVVQANPITIDNAGIVPVIENNATTSIVYVHNHSNQVISGITYSATLNTGSNQFLNTSSSGLCNSIPAHQSCPLIFTTPVLSETVAQGSALITADYTVQGKVFTFNQVISFERINNKQAKGALFNSGVLLNSAGNDTAYGTVYIYGSGENEVYTVNNILSNKAGVKITQGNLSGKQISSNYVSALEISAPANFAGSRAISAGTKNKATKNEDGFNAVLNMLSSMGSGSYSSTATIGVSPVSSGAILTSGNVPIINSSTASPEGTLFIVNAGNEDASLGTITYPDGVSRTGGTCGAILASGAGCSITFSIPQTGGSGNITVLYNSVSGGSKTLERTIVWYNGKGDALLSMIATPDPAIFNATESANINVSVTNIGGYNLTDVSAIQSATGGANAALQGSTACYKDIAHTESTGTTLVIGGVCEYTVNVTNNNDTAGYVRLSFSGSYTADNQTKSYERKLSVSYLSNPYAAILNVGNTQMAISGDDYESQTKTITVNNNGSAPAAISASSLSDNPAYLGIATNGCSGKTLQVNESCDVTLKLGPAASDSQITGTAFYNVAYSGGQSLSETATASVEYTVQAYSINMVMTGVSVSDVAITGNGTSGSPFQIPGYLSPQSVTLTYQNSGTTTIQIIGVDNTSSPIAWQIDPAISTCYNNGNLPSVAILVGNPCTIVFRNVLAENIAAIGGGLTATYVENIIAPTLTFQSSGKQFQIQAQAPTPIDSTTIYATGNQATITNSISNVGITDNTCFTGGDLCLKIEHSVTNATGYSTINITSTMESYFAGSISKTSNCNFSSTNGVTTQNCNLNPTDTTGNTIYRINPEYFGSTLHVLFGLGSNLVAGGYTPLSATESIPATKLIFVTVNTYPGDLATTGSGASGLEGADNLCNIESTNLHYPGHYKALLNGNNATTPATIYSRPDGKIIALATDNNLNGGGNLQTSIGIAAIPVWTGGGANPNSCVNWTSSASVSTGEDGVANANDSNWWDVNGVARNCNESAHLYCVQQ